jgi:glycosyltransferase involved in cell wall biosynthesis
MSGAHLSDRVNRLGAGGKRNLVTTIGVDIKQFDQARSSCRTEFTCITTRLLKKNSNVDFILEAIASVRDSQPRVHLTIVGEGPERPNLEALVRRLDLAPWVTFRGEVPNRLMPELLRTHDVYLSATASDGTSVSLLEAMACGAFPIVSDIPANRPWIRDGVTGFLVPLGHSELLTARILQAFGSPDLNARARRVNREVVEERGDYLSNMKECEAALQQLLNGRST